MMRTVVPVVTSSESQTPDGRFGAESARAVLDQACSSVGISTDGASPLRLGENALFHVPAGGGIVVRIARTVDYLPDVRNEVNVARWLQSVNFPAASVADISQPLVIDGHPVTFWAYIDGRAGCNDDVGALAELLKRLHVLPAPTSFRLPPENILGRVRPRIDNATVSDEDKRFLQERLAKLQDAVDNLRYPLAPGPTHGDAHSENLMIRGDKAILIDFERFAWGQPEWDLAMTATEYESAGWWSASEYDVFVQGYGFDVRTWKEGYPVLRSVHEIKMTTWLMQNVDESQEIADEYEARMLTMRGAPDAPSQWRPF